MRMGDKVLCASFALDKFHIQEKFEDTKEVIKSRKSKNRQYNGQMKKAKQLSTKHYTEN